MLAIVSTGHDEQMGWNLRALELAESSPAPRARRWRGSLYNNIGWTQHDAGRYDEALETFYKALRFREEQGTASDIRVARWCVARTLRSLARYDEALAIQRDLLHEMEQSGEPDGYEHEELGELLLALDREDEARGHFARAHALLSQDPWPAANEGARLQRLKDLGGV
jgi:tetratricopeptide (TPR) repeat protein